MALNLILDSRLAKGRTHDFTITFDPEIRLDPNKSYKAALEHLINMSYSWFNIRASYGNNTVKWRKKKENWQTVTFSDGVYNYQDIKSYLQNHTGLVDPNDKEKGYLFKLYFSNTALKVVIEIEKDYELDFAGGKFADLIGFDRNAVLKDKETYTGTETPDITKGVDWVNIHCDLIIRQASEVVNTVLFQISTANLFAGYPFEKEPRRLKFHPMPTSVIRKAHVWVTDRHNNLLDLNETPLALNLLIVEDKIDEDFVGISY